MPRASSVTSEEATQPVFAIGRNPELELLGARLAEAAQGRGSVLVLEGEAGIGKTHLVAACAQRATCLGMRMFEGRAEELEQDRTFGALVDALGITRRSSDPRRADIARLLTGAAAAPDPNLPYRLSEMILEIVEDAADQGPLLLAVEDLHWADVSTLRLLRRLARRVRRLEVLVLLTTRPSGRPDLAGLLVELASSGDHALIGPLGEEDLAELTRVTVGARPGQRLSQEIGRTGGNPLFATELIAALRDEGRLTVSAGVADIDTTGMSPSLRLTVLRRVSALREESVELLRVASVLGTTFSIRDLATVTRRPVLDLVGLLREATRAGFVRDAGERLSFSHDVVREALYTDMPADVRRAMHAEVGRALESSGSPVAQVAVHMALGAREGDAQATAVLRRAAARVAARSPATAADLLARALEVAGEEYPDREALEAEAATVFLRGGRADEGERLARRFLDCPHDPALAMRVARALLMALVWQGRVRDFLALLEQTRGLLGADGCATPAGERARLLADLAYALALLWQDPAEAVPLANEAVELGEQAKATDALPPALCALSFVRGLAGYHDEALELAERARRLVAATGHVSAGWSVHFHLHKELSSLGRLGESLAAADEAVRGAQLTGSPQLAPYLVSLGIVRFLNGEWDDAAAEWESGLETSEEVGGRVMDAWAHSLLAIVGVRRGDLSRAGRHVEAARPPAGEPDEPVVAWSRALLLEATGELRAAAEQAAFADSLVAEMGVPFLYPLLGLDLIRIASAGGEGAFARSVAAALDEQARRCAAPPIRGAALRARGILQNEAGALLEAVAAYAELPMPVYLAEAREDAGVVLARAGRREDGRALLEDAVRGYERVGAVRDMARAEAHLRALGVRRGAKGRRGRPSAGWSSLTPTELRVVALVGEGQSNREIAERLFISRRTVDAHLSHVFAKLGVSSRVELAVEATRQVPV